VYSLKVDVVPDFPFLNNCLKKGEMEKELKA